VLSARRRRWNLGAAWAGWEPVDPSLFAWLGGMVSLTALYMTTLILSTQRREDQLVGHREQLTLELAILGEQKSAKIIELLEEMRRDDLSLRNRVDHEAAAMSTPADPQAVLDAIKDSHEEVRLAEVVELSWRPFRRAASLLNKESAWCGVMSGKPEKGSRVVGVDDLKSLYLSELQEICDCEAQIAERLPKVAASTGSVELRTVTRQQARRSMLHWQKVEAILRRHGTSPKPGVNIVAGTASAWGCFSTRVSRNEVYGHARSPNRHTWQPHPTPMRHRQLHRRPRPSTRAGQAGRGGCRCCHERWPFLCVSRPRAAHGRAG